MKTSTVFIIVGAVAIGGYAAYRWWKSSEGNDLSGTSEDAGNSEDVRDAAVDSADNTENNSSEELSEVAEKLEQAKSNIQNDIVQRHEAAAKIIKDSMEHILTDDTEKQASENAGDLEDIDDALDKLLDE